MGHLQQAEIVLVPPDDLQADRQPLAAESQGTDRAGVPVTVMREQERIQSM